MRGEKERKKTFICSLLSPPLQAPEAGGAAVLLLDEAPPLLPGSGHPLLPASALGAHGHLPLQAPDRTGGPSPSIELHSIVTLNNQRQLACRQAPL